MDQDSYKVVDDPCPGKIGWVWITVQNKGMVLLPVEIKRMIDRDRVEVVVLDPDWRLVRTYKVFSRDLKARKEIFTG